MRKNNYKKTIAAHIEEKKANCFTENSNNDYICPSNIIINSLDIADGLKELLIKYGYTLELSSMRFSKPAEFLGIDLSVARIICTAARKLSDCNYHI